MEWTYFPTCPPLATNILLRTKTFLPHEFLTERLCWATFFCEIILQTYSLGTISRRESRGVQFPCPCPCRSLLGRPRLFQWQSASWFPPSPRLAQLHWLICPASKTPASGYGVTEASFPSNGGPCAGGGGRHFEPAGKPCSSRAGNREENSGTGPVRTEKLGGPGIVHWHKVPPLKAAANSWSS